MEDRSPWSCRCVKNSSLCKQCLVCGERRPWRLQQRGNWRPPETFHAAPQPVVGDAVGEWLASLPDSA